jgi:hypothetical protein
MTKKGLPVTLGVTLQHVQKYKKGANRISAVRLFRYGQSI